ncbi:hypothetical protein F4775DRAFT_564409 [Biscogniauxia sp. FL1348]|nr:hypothetical protein F4775DRAFT_564409 [Biscogniauxia sp. FL1348]
MVEISDLPPELVCPILETLIIDDIFSLRSVSRSFLAWIDCYIPAVAYSVARNTFPKARLLLRPTREGVYDFAWLRALIPRRLASIALDKDAMRAYNPTNSMRYRIPAEDDTGDLLRERVSGAWCLLRRIGSVYQDVYAVPLNPGVTISNREDMVYERALLMVKSLEPHECEAFFILAYVLLSAFHDENCRLRRWRYYLSNSAYKDSDGFCFFDCRARHVLRQKSGSELKSIGDASEHVRHPDHGNSWIWSWLFREGANAFWKQWGLGTMRPEAKNYVALRLQDSWSRRSEGQVHIERETSARIWYALMARSKPHDPQLLPLPLAYNSLTNPSNDILSNTLHDVYLRRADKGPNTIGKTMIEWYLWQEGKIDIDEKLSERRLSQERDTYLRSNSIKPDSLQDVPYIVSFKTSHSVQM